MITSEQMKDLADRIELEMWRDYNFIPGEVKEILTNLREGIYVREETE